MERFVTSDPLLVPEIREREQIARADLVFRGVDHSGPSYQARIFFNNPSASVATELSAETGYAGAFNVFGHGACYGDEGHCDPNLGYRDIFDLRPPHPILPITITVIVTEAIQRLTEEEFEVTVVAVDLSAETAAASEALEFEEIRLLLFED